MYPNNPPLFGALERTYSPRELIEPDSGLALSGLERSIRERFEAGVVGVVGTISSATARRRAASGRGVCACAPVTFSTECVLPCRGDGSKRPSAGFHLSSFCAEIPL
jgi:hypothetical protein|tara:strand:- start:219 stop:539 length:321 start_codon:yes stop_codon:yes gene_type:complete